MKQIVSHSVLKKIMVILFLIVPVTLLFAQEKGALKPVKQVSQEIENVALAKELAGYGYANESALALINAALIVIEESAAPLKVKSTERGGQAEEAEITLDAEKLLADAETFADGDKTLNSLIKSTRELTAASRGRVGGPGYVIDKVGGEMANIHAVEFTGGEAAEVAVVGSGNTDLDLYIFDESGNLIAMDEELGDECYVVWKPKWTGTFLLTVANRGSSTNEYALVTN